MAYVEEPFPVDSSSVQDYTKFFIEDDDDSKNFELYLPIIKKGENFQREHLLRKIPFLLNHKKIAEIIRQITLEIENYNDTLQLIFPKTLYDLATNIINSFEKDKPRYTKLLHYIIFQTIKLITNLEEKYSNEYIYYFDLLMPIIESKKIKINTEDKINEFVLGLGKFGQDKTNRKLCVYFSSVIFRINPKAIGQLFSRYNILFNDADRSVRLEIAHDVGKIIPKVSEIEEYRKVIFSEIENYLRPDEDVIIKCITICSLLRNVQYLPPSLISIVIDNCQCIFKSFDEADNELVENVFNVYLEFIQNVYEKGKTVLVDQFYNKQTIQFFVKKALFTQISNINLSFFEKILENFSQLMACLSFITKKDKNFQRAIIEKIFHLIDFTDVNDENTTIEDEKENQKKIQMKSILIRNLPQVVQHMEKTEVNILIYGINDCYDVIRNCDFNLLCKSICETPKSEIFVKTFFVKIIGEVEFLSLFENDDRKFFNFLKGVKKLISYVSKKNMKKVNEIYDYIFKQMKAILASNAICKIKNKAVKIIAQLIKYSSLKRDYYLQYCLNHTTKDVSFYSRRPYIKFLHYCFKIFSSNFIFEKNICSTIMNLFRTSDIPMEISEILDIFIYKNTVNLYYNTAFEKDLTEVEKRFKNDCEITGKTKTLREIIAKLNEPEKSKFQNQPKQKEEIEVSEGLIFKKPPIGNINKSMELKFQIPKSMKGKADNSVKLLPPISSPMQIKNVMTITENNFGQLMRREFKSKSNKLQKISPESLKPKVQKKFSSTPVATHTHTQSMYKVKQKAPLILSGIKIKTMTKYFGTRK